MKCFPLMSKVGVCAVLGLALAATGCKSGNESGGRLASPLMIRPTRTWFRSRTRQRLIPARWRRAASRLQPSSQPPQAEPAAPQSSAQYSTAQYNENNGYGEEPETYASQPPPALPELPAAA